MSDFTTANHGTIWTVTPCNAAARAHADDVLAQAMRWGTGYAIEARYGADVIEALLIDGYTVADELTGALARLPEDA